MNQDESPRYTINFGGRSDQLPYRERSQENSTANPESGVISRVLHDHPIMRFAAISAATMVGMHVAGKVARDGGVRLIDDLAREGNAVRFPGATRLAKDLQGFGKTWDAWEQTALKGRPAFWRGFHITEAEARGEIPIHGTGPWTWTDEIKHTLFKQARRLPYELPAAYATQRFVVDPLFGGKQAKNRPNWKNPVDVIADFGQQSLRNLFSFMLPFDAGTEATKYGWRKLMTANAPGAVDQGARSTIGVSIHHVLGEVGQDFTKMANTTMRHSQMTSGAFATALNESLSSSTGLVQHLHKYRSADRSRLQNLGAAVAQRNAAGRLVPNQDLFDTNIGPFGGIGTFVKTFKSQRERIAQEIEGREFVLNPETAGYPAGDPRRITARYRGAGHSVFEQYAAAIQDFAGTGVSDEEVARGVVGNRSSFRHGTFFREHLGGQYKEVLQERLVDNLKDQGVPKKDIIKLLSSGVQVQNLFKLTDRTPGNFRLGERIQFGSEPISYHGLEDYNQELLRRLHGVKDFRGIDVDKIVPQLNTSAIEADRIVRSNYEHHARQAEKAWDALYQKEILPHIKKRLGTERIPYATIEDGIFDPVAGRHVIGELAERLGIDTSHIAPEHRDDFIRQTLESEGVNLADGKQIRALLVQHGVASVPWEHKGFNIFGFRPLTVESATQKGYFEHQESRIQKQIQQIQAHLGTVDPILGEMNRLKVGGGVWENEQGQIVDLSPITSGIRGFFNIAAHRTQVPLVHIQPLMTLGYGAFRNLDQGGVLRYTPAYSANKFLGQTDPTVSHMWMGVGGAKGAVASLTQDVTQKLPGLYRAPTGDLFSLPGRALRATVPGRGIIEAHTQNRRQEALNIDTYQPGSFWRFLKRFQNRADDIRNPSVYARKLLEAGNIAGPESIGGDLRGQAFAKLLEQYSPADLAAGQKNLERTLRGYGFGGRSARILGEKHLGLNPIWSTPVKGIEGEVTQTFNQLLSQGSDAEIINYVRKLSREDLAGLDDFASRKMQFAQQRLRTMLSRQYDESGKYFSGLASRAMQKAGVNTRLNEFQQELRQYVVLRAALLEGTSAQMPSDLIGDLLGTLEANRAHLTASEIAEYRAAILGTQIQWMKITARQVVSTTEQDRLLDVAKRLASPGATDTRGLLENVASNDYQLGRSSLNIPFSSAIKKAYFKRFSTAADEFPDSYNPFGGNARSVIIPTFGTAVQRAGPVRALKSVAGLTTYSDPEAFSLSATPAHHFFTRLNRYFQLLGAGLDESQFKGPLGYYTKGIIGRRVLPIVAGGALLTTADATAGGLIHDKDDQGNRDYSPPVLGHFARGMANIHAGFSGLIPGGPTFRSKRQELLSGEVAVRKGRYWPLGNTPIKGGRIQYFRPSLSRRIGSGYKYTPDTFGSPLEKLAFYDDFSPLRPFDPYRFERKHYADRPYPVTGEYFSGPWGPLTSALNLTIGRILKPPTLMHEDELNSAIAGLQPVGRSAMVAPMDPTAADTGRFYTRVKGRPSIVSPIHARKLLSGEPTPASLVADANVKNETLTNVISIPMRHGDRDAADDGIGIPTPGTAYVTGGSGNAVAAARVGRSRSAISAHTGSGLKGHNQSKITIAEINRYYEKAANGQRPMVPDYDVGNMPILQSGSGMSPRTLAKKKPVSGASQKILAGQLGYEAQELFGIYGWGFGAARNALGFGRTDLSPRGPTLIPSSRAYGSERSFWDLNLGGLGDTPLPFEGEYANLEFSEISRRFIPHRRRDITEYNPIPNSVGQQYPWLPGSNYFLNFQQGDPYSLIPEGEMRLPGAGYEKFNKLHPDVTGKYGLIDKFKILGDVAPYSDQYRAMNSIISRLELTPEEKAIVTETRRQVSQQNKRQEFSPYIYSHQHFAQTKATVLGRVKDTADQYWTDQFSSPIRLAGVRARSEAAQRYMDKTLRPGAKVNLTYDANQEPLAGPSGAIDVIAERRGKNISKTLLDSVYGHKSRTNTPLEALMRTPKLEYPFKEAAELLAHRNTYINAKFLPHRTPVEAWERQNVYGASFAQWHHPIKDFLEPMIYKGASRNPLSAAIGLGFVGAMFAVNKPERTVGALIGAGVGIGASTLVNANKYGLGERFIPLRRKQEIGVEEYSDILNYVKYQRLYNQARSAAQEREKTDPEVIARQMEEAPKGTEPIAAVGPITAKALQFRKQTRQTLYGADPFGDIMDIYAAMPKRKRDYFMPFLNAPVSDRPKILSTAGRLERRIYESRWDMPVEEKPDLTGYFQKHELPGADWEGWSPDVSMESVKLKIVQHAGLDASQMGYYPQQVQEANLQNPTYPNINQQSSELQVRAQLQKLMGKDSTSNKVRIMRTAYPGTRVLFNVGAN